MTNNTSSVTFFTLLFMCVAIGITLLQQISFFPFTQAQSLSCTSHNFKCCKIVNYPVMGLLADQWDKQTCQMIDFMLNGKLSNYSRECKQAYVDSYCLSTIPQCCPGKPVFYRVCASVCNNLLQKCGTPTFNATTCNQSPPFYPAPCNSGRGASCQLATNKILNDNEEK